MVLAPRILMAALGTLAVPTTVIGTLAFNAWLAVQNRIYYGAVEVGRTPIYPENHSLFGVISVTAVILSVTVAVCTWGHLILTRTGREGTPASQIMLVVAGLLAGLGIPATAQFATLGLAPIVVAAVLIVVAIKNRRTHAAVEFVDQRRLEDASR